MKFGWKIIVGSIIGFLGAAFGSVGGVGGGGIFVPTLTLIIGFDPKSSTAISKCKRWIYSSLSKNSVKILLSFEIDHLLQQRKPAGLIHNLNQNLGVDFLLLFR